MLLPAYRVAEKLAFNESVLDSCVMLLPAYKVAEMLVVLEFGTYIQLLFEILQGEPARFCDLPHFLGLQPKLTT